MFLNQFRTLSVVSFAVLAMVAGAAAPACARAQQSGQHGGWARVLQGLAAASAPGGSLVGRWQGGKTENDPIHGGYLNISFTFVFSADGTYQETAYMGGRQVMVARGTYQQGRGAVMFTPQECQFASPELGNVVKFFPIPTDAPTQDSISASPLGGGVLLSLKDQASGEDWGLKNGVVN